MKSVANQDFVQGISVIMPCFNEEDHSLATLESVKNALSQIAYENSEIIVVDCNSDDASLEILNSIQSQFPLRIISIDAQNTAKALNAGFANAKYSFRARCDFHSQYPETYFSDLLEVLEKESHIGFVGFPIKTIPGTNTITAEAIALALSSKIGVGDSTFRVAKHEQRQKNLVLSDTAPFGCWRASDQVLIIGEFNEELPKNQDDEFCARFIKAGKKVVVIMGRGYITYFGRTSFKALLAMYYNYGLFKPASRHYKISAFRARHFAPAVFVISNVVVLAQAPFAVPSAPLVLLGIYFFVVQIHAPWRLKLHFSTSVFLMHVSYGFGFLRGWATPRRLLKDRAFVSASR